MSEHDELPQGPYEIVYADPPWLYYGDPHNDQAAGKHYPLMATADIGALSVQDIVSRPAALFLWATTPRLPQAIEVMHSWGFHFRGVAYVWVKTAKDGHIIGGQGVRPTFTKPTTEFLLVGSTNRRGRASRFVLRRKVRSFLHRVDDIARSPLCFGNGSSSYSATDRGLSCSHANGLTAGMRGAMRLPTWRRRDGRSAPAGLPRRAQAVAWLKPQRLWHRLIQMSRSEVVVSTAPGGGMDALRRRRPPVRVTVRFRRHAPERPAIA